MSRRKFIYCIFNDTTGEIYLKRLKPKSLKSCCVHKFTAAQETLAKRFASTKRSWYKHKGLIQTSANS